MCIGSYANMKLLVLFLIARMLLCKVYSCMRREYSYIIPFMQKNKFYRRKTNFNVKVFTNFRDSASNRRSGFLKCLSFPKKTMEGKNEETDIKEESKVKEEGKESTKRKIASDGNTKTKKAKAKSENDVKKGSLFNCTVKEDDKVSDLTSPKFNPVHFDVSNLYLSQKDKEKHKFKDSLLFTFLTNTFNQIEELKGSGTGSKKNVAIILSNVFRVLIYYSPNDLIPAVYITLNKVAPDYLNVEAGVGEALILKTMSEAYSRTESSIKKDLQQIEDLGIIAESCSCKMRTIFPLPRLTIQSVFNELKSIPNLSGSNSQQKKREVIKKLLVSAKTSEAKYIVRFLQQRLRIGVNSATVLQALSYAFILTRPFIPEEIVQKGKLMNEQLLSVKGSGSGEEDDNVSDSTMENEMNKVNKKKGGMLNVAKQTGESPSHVKKENEKENQSVKDEFDMNALIESIKMRNEKISKPNLFYDIGKEGDTRLLPIFKELKKSYCEINNDSDIFECMEKSVKSALCELPNIEIIIQNLLNGDDMNTLSKKCTVKAGLPVQPMLAKPTKGIQEVLDRFNNVTFTCEYKYDGERAQIHYIDKDNIKIFSRNLETMTEKYPDVIQIVRDQIISGATECIIDSEVVAYDIENKKILPFQVLTTRKRKDVDIENIKVKICLFPFDLICCNGVPVIKEPLEIRRKLLYSLLKCKEGVLCYATHSEMNNVEDMDIFLQDAIENNCEGLMVKTLLDNASYEPSRRSLNWLKVKKDYIEGLSDSVDLVPIAGYYGKGKRSGVYGAFVLATYNSETENFQTVCKAGTGFSDEILGSLYDTLSDKIIPSKKSYYEVSDKLNPDVWFDAHYVWEVKAADLSLSPVHTAAIGVYSDDKGIGLRFPRFLRLREDKNAEQATTSQQIVDLYEAQFTYNKNKNDFNEESESE
ncbi:DNA ligase I, putative [Plasmodium knowlesi strain H]|uniref:DNA ligase n=3 Tax=Plasmodium knowlesi TaxID=5850 RepID=A0A5K1TW62_PLAKH|nr:DNA ligase I, putative [Plasmodium knowlesi strain H]OTN63603.1 DNA ligase [Plasmodium knowlesi]CAA9990642.1 DNA ligase I, putative [Plasmodium knowlesi strain H]SBO26002.1 DNA ligase I, putative [Plasmodium knowlesi strain H]SBO28716.1 DNA ligase I, putative [Plasmodium knowlesi strain H]VVS80116.1 DNA ligase I, putative [Plasmodium knowlesi strain H]|eukprot:XP_002261933.1 DNA ligase 1, putative [Plasmodium knowlesi strain H]